MYIPPAVIIFTQSIDSMKEIFIECPPDNKHFATFVDTATVMSTYTSMGDGQGPLFTAQSVWCRRSLCVLIHLMSSPRCLSAEEHGKQTQTLSIFFCSASSQWKRGLDSWMCSVGSERWGWREDHASPPWQLWEGSQVSLLSITAKGPHSDFRCWWPVSPAPEELVFAAREAPWLCHLILGGQFGLCSGPRLRQLWSPEP